MKAKKKTKNPSPHRSNRFYQGNVSRRDTVKRGRHSCPFAAEYAYESITPADVRCSPLLTSLPPANPAYPPYWPLLPGSIHRTRPVIPLCADVSLFTPTFTARGKWLQICHCDQKNVSRWCCRVPGPPAKKTKQNLYVCDGMWPELTMSL